jgi:hypothetical protein
LSFWAFSLIFLRSEFSYLFGCVLHVLWHLRKISSNSFGTFLTRPKTSDFYSLGENSNFGNGFWDQLWLWGIWNFLWFSTSALNGWTPSPEWAPALGSSHDGGRGGERGGKGGLTH